LRLNLSFVAFYIVFERFAILPLIYIYRGYKKASYVNGDTFSEKASHGTKPVGPSLKPSLTLRNCTWKRFYPRYGYQGTSRTLRKGFHVRTATFIHGVYDDVAVMHTELVNCPDWLPLVLVIAGEACPGSGTCYQRS